MSGANEGSVFITHQQRKRILISLFEAYYAELAGHKLIFDTHRVWSSYLPILSELFPAARVICCVRNPAWILDSIERRVQCNLIQPSRVFNHEPFGNVYTRAEHLAKALLGISLNNLRQAWYGEYANHLIAVRYDSLTQRPAETLRQLYDFLGEEHYEHDFNHVDYDEPLFDAYLGLPGLHRVSGPVVARTRKTILPPDLFSRYDQTFWDVPDENPRGVTII
jgi:sulfotransferase